jgi:serine/threonine protein kinase
MAAAAAAVSQFLVVPAIKPALVAAASAPPSAPSLKQAQVVYCSYHQNRAVLRLSPTSNVLIKVIRHRYDREVEDDVRKLLTPYDPDGKYFVFWKAVPGIYDSAQLRQTFPSLAKLKTGPYHIMTSIDGGQTLDATVNAGMTASPAHALRVLRHLVEALEIMDKAGVRHNDTRCPNVLLGPTPDERKTRVFTTTLPRLIDFGACEPEVPEPGYKPPEYSVPNNVALLRMLVHDHTDQKRLIKGEKSWVVRLSGGSPFVQSEMAQFYTVAPEGYLCPKDMSLVDIHSSLDKAIVAATKLRVSRSISATTDAVLTNALAVVVGQKRKRDDAESLPTAPPPSRS